MFISLEVLEVGLLCWPSSGRMSCYSMDPNCSVKVGQLPASVMMQASGIGSTACGPSAARAFPSDQLRQVGISYMAASWDAKFNYKSFLSCLLLSLGVGSQRTCMCMDSTGVTLRLALNQYKRRSCTPQARTPMNTKLLKCCTNHDGTT